MRMRGRNLSAWLPTLLVLGLILAAGSRLIVLSLQQHALQARSLAQESSSRFAHTVEAQLRALTDQSLRQASRASATLGFGDPWDADQDMADPATRLGSIPPARDTLWLDARGAPLTHTADPTLAPAIAAEWSTSHSADSDNLLGPMRHGSNWLIAARAPITVPGTGGAPRRVGWAVGLAGLDQLVSSARLGALAKAGYDFALVQTTSAGGEPRVFFATRDEPLSNAVASRILPPAGFHFGPQTGDLQLQLKPRAGWFPASEIATDVGLLAVVAWLLAFATHDGVHRLQRLQAALHAERERVHRANQRLMQEVEERQSLQQSFEHARYHDAFTGLPNRRYFMDQLDRALRELRSHRRRCIAVVLMDIDRFQLVNDTLGHTAGDELMVQVARRFERTAPAGQSVLARWGGDQFALLLLEVADEPAAVELASALQAALAEPLEVRRHRINVSLRIGVTVVEGGPRRAEDVVREADIALSAAKRRDVLSAVTYSPALGGHAATLVSLEADLHVALERGELKLLFQPIVDLRAQRMVGAEALLRWQHPVEGLLSPERFLSIAEEAGLMVPITRWAVASVCRLAHQWRRRLPAGTEFFFSINLSGAVLRDTSLSEYVAAVLAETQTPTQVLKFELTEDGLISNVGGARELLEQLHNMGIELMLDDFGTGYSSLNYLQLFPFDYLKIDRPVLDPQASEQANSGLIAAMVQIAETLGLVPIAEVVETQAAAQTLERLGCSLGQGYFFSAPIEAEDALHCLRGEQFAVAAEAEAEDDWVDDSPTMIIPVSELPEDDGSVPD